MDGWMDALHDQLTLASSAYSCISLRSPERSASLSTVLPSLPVREAPLSLLATLVDDDDDAAVLPSGSLSVPFGLNLMMNSLPVRYIYVECGSTGRAHQMMVGATNRLTHLSKLC